MEKKSPAAPGLSSSPADFFGHRASQSFQPPLCSCFKKKSRRQSLLLLISLSRVFLPAPSRAPSSRPARPWWRARTPCARPWRIPPLGRPPPQARRESPAPLCSAMAAVPSSSSCSPEWRFSAQTAPWRGASSLLQLSLQVASSPRASSLFPAPLLPGSRALLLAALTLCSLSWPPSPWSRAQLPPTLLVYGDFPLLAAVRPSSIPAHLPARISFLLGVRLLARWRPSLCPPVSRRLGVFMAAALPYLPWLCVCSARNHSHGELAGVHPLRLLAVDLPSPASSSLRLFALACAAPLRSSRRSSSPLRK
jgi:hypothetical protein